MKASVIIPIYNTGQYLRSCIESICRQTHRDLQIIMIDDGSDSHTAAICDELAASDRRIELVHKRNEGVSKARNTGLDMAMGDVVCFVDSDDSIEPDMIETMIESMTGQESQIAMCDAITITPGKPDEADSIPDYDTSCVIEVGSISPATLTRLAGSACRCAYRRTDTLLAKQARFPEGLKFSEDRIFNIIAMSGAQRISYLKRPLYKRLIREGSACHSYYPDMTEQIVLMRSALTEAVRKNWGEAFIPEYERQIAAQIRYAVTNFTSKVAENKLRKLRQLCGNPSIRQCIEAAGATDIRSRFIMKQHSIGLLILGYITNIYHRLCKA